MQFEIRSVVISPSEIQQAIASLDEAIALNTRLKALCEEILAVQGGAVKRPRGRPRKTALEDSGIASVRRPGRGGRPRAGEKTLRQFIEQVLVGQSGPLKPKDLMQAVLDAGYVTTGKRSSLYTSVFNTAKASPLINKTKAGFSLKAGATPSTGRVTKKKTKTKKSPGKKKRGRPRKKA